MAMNELPEDGPSRLELPAFVTHGPKGNEAKYISTLYKLARDLDDELCSEQAWVAKRLVSLRLTHSTPYFELSCVDAAVQFS